MALGTRKYWQACLGGLHDSIGMKEGCGAGKVTLGCLLGLGRENLHILGRNWQSWMLAFSTNTIPTSIFCRQNMSSNKTRSTSPCRTRAVTLTPFRPYNICHTRRSLVVSLEQDFHYWYCRRSSNQHLSHPPYPPLPHTLSSPVRNCLAGLSIKWSH